LRAHLEAEKERLEDAVSELEREERELLSEASGENNYRDHMADQGSATFERELDMTLEENVRVQLGEVRAALQRVEAGDYGVCERCKADIPSERLEAVPTASLCVACKEAEEHY
jgi:DnaK suppressor protein